METTKTSPDASHVATKALSLLLVTGWLALTAWAAGVLLIVATLSVAAFFGEPPTAENWVEGVGFSVAGVITAAAGPLGVWLFHRRRGWLIAAGYVVLITVAGAVYLLLVVGAG